MINHIIFFTYIPFTPKIENDFYFRELIAAGYKVTFIDLTKVFSNDKAADNAVERPFVVRVGSLAEFDRIMSDAQGPSTMAIPIITYNYQVLSLFRMISRYDMKLGFFARGMMPVPALLVSPFKRLLTNPLTYLSMKRAVRFIQNKYALYYKRSGKIRKYDAVFVAGKSGEMTIGIGSGIDAANARMININYFDYDTFLDQEAVDEKPLDVEYYVFVDQYLPHHPDIALLNMDQINVTQYYSALNEYFDKLEAKHKIKVVIAAHPKADYTNNPFNGRTIFTNKTAELVRHAQLVLMHFSSAVSFCVLYNKPVFVLYNSIISKVYSKYHLGFMCETIGGYMINMDDDTAIIDRKDITTDTEKYRKYKYNYLTSPESEARRSADIFLEFLKEL